MLRRSRAFVRTQGLMVLVPRAQSWHRQTKGLP